MERPSLDGIRTLLVLHYYYSQHQGAAPSVLLSTAIKLAQVLALVSHHSSF